MSSIDYKEINNWRKIRSLEVRREMRQRGIDRELVKSDMHDIYVEGIKLDTMKIEYENLFRRPYDPNCNSSDVDW